MTKKDLETHITYLKRIITLADAVNNVAGSKGNVAADTGYIIGYAKAVLNKLEIELRMMNGAETIFQARRDQNERK